MSVDGNVPSPAVRVGLVGAGAWARRAYLPALLANPKVALVALAEPDQGVAGLAADLAEGIAVFASAQAMLAAVPLDLVCVVTPDDCHLADAGAALSAGAAVLCEKPLAVTVDDARTLVAMAQGIPTRVGFTLRYAAAVRRFRELVVAGAIGEPRLFQAFQQNGQFLDPTKPAHWKMDGTRTGGGAIVEYGIHSLDLAHWIMGDVERVTATSRTWITERPEADAAGKVQIAADDSTAWLMEFTGGALGLCHAGWATPGRAPGVELRVYGATGAVRCLLQDDLPGDEGLWLAGPDGRFEPVEIPRQRSARTALTQPWSERWPADLIGDFVVEIAGLGPPDPDAPTFVDGLRAQETLAAVVAAAREDRWVAVRRS